MPKYSKITMYDRDTYERAADKADPSREWISKIDRHGYLLRFCQQSKEHPIQQFKANRYRKEDWEEPIKVGTVVAAYFDSQWNPRKIPFREMFTEYCSRIDEATSETLTARQFLDDLYAKQEATAR